jgi:hypothetical protein
LPHRTVLTFFFRISSKQKLFYCIFCFNNTTTYTTTEIKHLRLCPLAYPSI